MSDFGDFNAPSEDPTADFLARERAALGEDADLFSSNYDTTNYNNNNVLSPSLSVTSPVPAMEAAQPMTPSSFNDTPALLDNNATSSPQTSSSVPQQVESNLVGNNSFDSQFPEAENLETSQAFQKALLPEEEPEVVRQWREKQKELIAERDAEAEKKREETIKQAREDIDKFYEEYNDKKQKAIEENREREDTNDKKRDEVSSSANVWERVAREVDLTNAKTGYHTHDVGRMKELMMELKRDTKAPGNIVQA
ncbi:clathrin light chain [Mycotypha africana]|uniref:clathrin light chain n=1 Tax=Mycotypha africana TaxID=64632 RepID=UPI0022FFC9F4|nr:clathrin light chain [Mycotypha africana]KAI8973505.1 clathrin light chain [Mycotypha africana]